MDKIFASFLSALIKSGSMRIETASGRTFKVGDGSGEEIRLRFADRAAQWALIRDPVLHFGELYMDGRVTVERGTIYDVLAIASRNVPQLGRFSWFRGIERFRAALAKQRTRNNLLRARRNVSHHYDLDRRLYEIFLDSDRQYSCAYFEHPSAGLDEAQLAKKRHIAAKLLIEPGDRVLDIGSGWGGMGLYLAEMTGADVTGVTLSTEQLQVSNARASEKNLTQSAKFLLEDYRDIPGPFERIVSVGMFEHVGVDFYETYFRRCAELLTDDGIMVLHSIGRSHGPDITNPWIAKYIFPGGYIPSLSEVIPAIERSGLLVCDVEILRLHYAETLKAWR